MNDQTIGVVGLGLLGRSITTCLLSHGFKVIAYGRTEDERDAARKYIEQAVDDMHEHGQLPAAADGWRDRLTIVDSLQPFAPCDYVIESIIEDVGAKIKVYDQLESIIGGDVPIGINTSAIPISTLQHGRKHPQRFVGMHWAEPAQVLRFMEVIRGDKTDDATVRATQRVGYAAGKEPGVVKKDVRGFVCNRMWYAILREAFHMLESGVADIETIDASFRNDIGMWSALAGPFRYLDLTGIPAYATVMKDLAPELSNADTVPKTLADMAASGARGTANAKGFYEYTDEEARQWEQRFEQFTWQLKPIIDAHLPLRGPDDAT